MMLSLESACEFLSRIPNIDNGGCGIAAYSIYKFMLKNKISTKNFKIIACYPNYGDENSYNEYESDLESIVCGNPQDALYCDHIMFTVNAQFTDVHLKLVPEYLDVCETIEISPKELEIMINNGNWCADFNRKKHIPIIEEKLDISLKDIK